MACPIMCPPVILGGSILSKYIGLDDMIFGLWSGALVTVIFILIIDLLDKMKIKFFLRKPLIFVSVFFISYYPLYFFKFISFTSFIWIFDKFLFGSFIGILTIFCAEHFNKYLIRKNNGKVYFKFQKLLIPIIFLLLFSILIYILL